jgi:hypothetical protein
VPGILSQRRSGNTPNAKKTPKIALCPYIAGVTPHALAAGAALLADLPREDGNAGWN